MAFPLFFFVRGSIDSLRQAVKRRLGQRARPENHDLVLNVTLDPPRSKSELILDSTLLSHQWIVLRLQVKRPAQISNG